MNTNNPNNPNQRNIIKTYNYELDSELDLNEAKRMIGEVVYFAIPTHKIIVEIPYGTKTTISEGYFYTSEIKDVKEYHQNQQLIINHLDRINVEFGEKAFKNQEDAEDYSKMVFEVDANLQRL